MSSDGSHPLLPWQQPSHDLALNLQTQQISAVHMSANLLIETFWCVCCQDPEKVPPYLSGLLWRTPVPDWSLSGTVTNLASVFLLRILQLTLHRAFIWSQETTGDHRPALISTLKEKMDQKNRCLGTVPGGFSPSHRVDSLNVLIFWL